MTLEGAIAFALDKPDAVGGLPGTVTLLFTDIEGSTNF